MLVLHRRASRPQRLASARSCLEHGATLAQLDAVDPYGVGSCLDMALVSRWAYEGFADGVRLLLEHGAKADACSPVSSGASQMVKWKGRGPLEMAIHGAARSLQTDDELQNEADAMVGFLLTRGAHLDPAPAISFTRRYGRGPRPSTRLVGTLAGATRSPGAGPRVGVGPYSATPSIVSHADLYRSG